MRSRHQRPIAVTIVGWVYRLVALGFLVGLVEIAADLDRGIYKEDVPLSWILVHAVGGAIWVLLACHYLFRGAAWARGLMACYLFALPLWMFIAAKVSAVFWVALLWSGVFAVALFSPQSSAYFYPSSYRRRRRRSSSRRGRSRSKATSAPVSS